MKTFDNARRDLLKLTGLGLAATLPTAFAGAQTATPATSPLTFDVRRFGASANGKQLDTPAINAAIDAAAAAGGGTVYFPAGTYLCFSIHLKSNVALYLDQGATILAADSPQPGQTTGQLGGQYDAAEPNTAWDAYQDYGHNHWHNSLFWGEDLQRPLHHSAPASSMGQGSQLRRRPRQAHPPPQASHRSRFRPGTHRHTTSHNRRSQRTSAPYAASRGELPHVPSRATWRRQQGHRTQELPQRSLPRLLHPQGRPLRPAAHRRRQPHPRQPQDRHRPRRHGHRLLQERARLQLHRQLAVGRRHLPQVQSFALGYNAPYRKRQHHQLLRHRSLLRARHGARRHLQKVRRLRRQGPRQDRRLYRPHQVRHRVQRWRSSTSPSPTASSKAARASRSRPSTEPCCEDIAVTNITMRDVILRAPSSSASARACAAPEAQATSPQSSARYAACSSRTSSATTPPASTRIPSNITGIPGHPVEDLKISDVYVAARQGGGGSRAGQRSIPPGKRRCEIPRARRCWASIPAHGFYFRHVNRNLEMSHIEISPIKPDARTSFYLQGVDRADFLAMTAPHAGLHAEPGHRLPHPPQPRREGYDPAPGRRRDSVGMLPGTPGTRRVSQVRGFIAHLGFAQNHCAQPPAVFLSVIRFDRHFRSATHALPDLPQRPDVRPVYP